jgi:hypothetical protein
LFLIELVAFRLSNLGGRDEIEGDTGHADHGNAETNCQSSSSPLAVFGLVSIFEL